MAMIEIKDVFAGYGIGPDILTGLSLNVVAGRSYCIVGPNGAGKSTLLKVICGQLPPRSGSVMFNGQDLAGLRTDEVLERGICFVPQDRSLFTDMTIRENLQMGGYILKDSAEIDRRIEGVLEMFPVLKSRLGLAAKTLSGGQQQQLLIGRALVLRPKVIMLDEPTLGLAPKISRQIFDSMNELKAAGIAIIVVEQNARMGLNFADWGCVLDLGRMVFEGPSQDVLSDERIEQLYLGRKRQTEAAS
ncbi:ABC transporter ATP-binding protein [Roseisalinus antarcticus]|uniref:High-affinity branched-chain amino acid transport ATP-binding protein LivF n=1 Tax=Roseisalinus antarcticus TaxID=254357 RepID=A0A1Y5U661_9RHOB|nr:ABC transporter ATP-binding protein [Roseisalinus antarcticus]SLN77928.1 High-affinity branched-chain amino acid transport ATP-binding protein LivF [Roseisalinus antarcticus]